MKEVKIPRTITCNHVTKGAVYVTKGPTFGIQGSLHQLISFPLSTDQNRFSQIRGHTLTRERHKKEPCPLERDSSKPFYISYFDLRIRTQKALEFVIILNPTFIMKEVICSFKCFIPIPPCALG